MSKVNKIVDYLVLGAGSGGLLVTVGLQKLGKDVAVVSKNIGGDCTHFGCVPSKTLLHLSKIYQMTTNRVEKEELRASALQTVVKTIRSFEEEEKLLIPNENFYQGSAEFVDSDSVRVQSEKETQIIRFRKKCIIATGSRPIRISVEGLENKRIITNEELFYLKSLPKSITIFGGGPIGAELATACINFGLETYLVSRSYLPKEPAEISERSLKSLTEQGVNYHSARPSKFENSMLHLDNGTDLPETEIYLSAVGRSPNINISLENASIEFDESGIKVDKNLLTLNSNVFAIGDCTQNPQFTHLAANHGKFVLKKIAVPFAQRRERALPRVTFTSPTVASVGDLEPKKNTKFFKLPFTQTDKGRTNFETDGYGIVSVDVRSGKIKGISLYGDFSEDLINVFTLIIDQKIGLLELADFITPYPTYANILHSLVVEYLAFTSQHLKQRPLSSLYQLIKYVVS